MKYKCLKCGFESDDEIEFIKSCNKNQRLLCNECSEVEEAEK